MIEVVEHNLGLTVKIRDNSAQMYKDLIGHLKSGKVVKISLERKSLITHRLRRLCSEYFLIPNGDTSFQRPIV